MTFSEMLKKLRNQKGITQEELAEATGLKRSAIGMYESGNREPNFETLELFADFFNVDMNTLFDKNNDNVQGYYLDPKAAKIAQDIQDNPQLKILFDAAVDADPDSLKLLSDMMLKIRGKELGDDD